MGTTRNEFGGSEFLHVVHDRIRGVPPQLDLSQEAALQRVLVEGAASGVIRSAHDCAEGGVAVTLAECCFDTPFGVEVDLARVFRMPLQSIEKPRRSLPSRRRASWSLLRRSSCRRFWAWQPQPACRPSRSVESGEIGSGSLSKEDLQLTSWCRCRADLGDGDRVVVRASVGLLHDVVHYR